ncbi:hypothetical protein ACFLSV_00340 [Bacteroidota bacterium]
MEKINKNLTNFDSLWNYRDPKGTEDKFRRLLGEAKSSCDNSYYAQLLSQIARAQGLQRKFEEAHKILDDVEKLLTDDMVVARMRYYLERGRTFNSSNYSDKARFLFMKSYELGKENNEGFFIIDAVHMLGIVDKGEDSLKWNELAIKITEESEDKRAKGWLDSLYNNTGWSLHDMKEYERALDYFERNVKWHKERNSKQELFIAKWCVARTYRSLNKIEDALKMQMDLLKEIEEKK